MILFVQFFKNLSAFGHMCIMKINQHIFLQQNGMKSVKDCKICLIAHFFFF